MPQYLCVSNTGEVDTQHLHLMGISTKRGDESKIGFFGSGNKYAIAVLLHHHIPFSIFSGTRKVKITTTPLKVGGETYSRILVDGIPTSLTTAMGPDWEPWFALREFYSNAVDEGGFSVTTTSQARGKEGTTRIFVQLTKELQKFLDNPEDYLLLDTPPLDTKETEYGEVSIYQASQEGLVLYRKGIRICPDKQPASLYRYNFSDVKINESRVVMYSHQPLERAAAYFTACEDGDTIRHLLAHSPGKWEAGIEWRYVSAPLSPAWAEILEGRFIYSESLAKISGDAELKAGSLIVPDDLADKIAKDLPEMQVVGADNGSGYVLLEETPEEKKQLSEAQQELDRIGYAIPQEIRIAHFRVRGVLGYYCPKEDRILLTREVFPLGRLELLSTILEEYFHSKGYRDASREFVTFLTKEIIHKGQVARRMNPQ